MKVTQNIKRKGVYTNFTYFGGSVDETQLIWWWSIEILLKFQAGSAISKKNMPKDFHPKWEIFCDFGGFVHKISFQNFSFKVFVFFFFLGGGVVGVCRLRKGIFGEDKIGSP